ncbi:MAG: hypothetical protein IH960_13185, partial [Chloroflexi bacterium]|nr:hypothetical protein [Chloroflexota bacterium]
VNPATGRASMSLVAGRLIMFKGRAVGRGGTWLVLEEGRAAAESSGLPFEVMNLENSRLYENWK